MSNLLEIRWHARGGQGAKTASTLLAETSMAAGKYVQGFPEYGPERMGAPMKAYNRIGDIPITIHSNVENPDVVMVLDPTLVGPVNVTEGLKPDGIIIINTTLSPEEAKQKLDRDDIKVATVDASGIAVDCIGRDIPNTPMMGALLKLVEILPFEEFIERMRADLTAKFRGRENIVEGNIKAIRRAYEEVKLA
ncbi:MAG TPA: 2-oxoacid:acceptor oxidoreductase family protein [Bacillota bacterium]|nr:2-oxoacid:acceptor oxidoreductase family protein [Bacillota bacterium]HOP70597.1 2-oxoacid:acceptor oxidoreductase family protein [Bacillota bacterium]HPT36118.1 2-oxoacid:acceptor oxidoreductase family protein [Bacillota bacterium]HPZ85851.1 2-oxoacid:acceptor oxidoreductase family protein [Bacillota bacterium]HQD86939.1 2-oxoacid:acceptor oxidoreductase family protein [Bacillota bacterium]